MSTADSLRVSEIFESIQGEGASAGAPAIFLRLATCNLRCSWCDTKYTWDWESHRYEEEVRTESVARVAARLAEVTGRRLVITGGEPLLQDRALSALVALLPAALPIEIETNGTLEPSASLLSRVNQWNVSPKLANGGDPRERRILIPALLALRDTGRAWLKLVISAAEDVAEAEALIAETAFPRERVLLMPQAATRAELAERGPLVTLLGKQSGLAVSPRLHVERWDGRRGT
jgi:organic radical activating enzyme